MHRHFFYACYDNMRTKAKGEPKNEKENQNSKTNRTCNFNCLCFVSTDIQEIRRARYDWNFVYCFVLWLSVDCDKRTGYQIIKRGIENGKENRN